MEIWIAETAINSAKSTLVVSNQKRTFYVANSYLCCVSEPKNVEEPCSRLRIKYFLIQRENGIKRTSMLHVTSIELS